MVQATDGRSVPCASLLRTRLMEEPDYMKPGNCGECGKPLETPRDLKNGICRGCLLKLQDMDVVRDGVWVSRIP